MFNILVKERLKWLSFFYNFVYDEVFRFKDLECIAKMQNLVYFLQISGGMDADYFFFYYGTTKTYSSELFDDCLKIPEEGQSKIFPLPIMDRDSNDFLKNLKRIFTVPKNSFYTKKQWSECIVKLQYLRWRRLPSSYSNEQVINYLISKNPQLNDVESNLKAIKKIKLIFGKYNCQK